MVIDLLSICLCKVEIFSILKSVGCKVLFCGLSLLLRLIAAAAAAAAKLFQSCRTLCDPIDLCHSFLLGFGIEGGCIRYISHENINGLEFCSLQHRFDLFKNTYF